jgi:hypothetical protein
MAFHWPNVALGGRYTRSNSFNKCETGFIKKAKHKLSFVTNSFSYALEESKLRRRNIIHRDALLDGNI